MSVIASLLSCRSTLCFSFSGEYTISHRFLHITLACAFIIARICVYVSVVFAADRVPHLSKYSCCIVITPLQSGISLPNLISSSYALACPSSVMFVAAGAPASNELFHLSGLFVTRALSLLSSYSMFLSVPLPSVLTLYSLYIYDLGYMTSCRS
jgi:hypothetical protein